jgi:5'-nucleotidase
VASSQFILGVDLDAVCADYVEAFRQVVAADRGVAPGTLTSDVSWDFASWGLDRSEFLRLHQAGVESGMFATMPAIEGASEALWRLSNADIWIRVITHRLIMNGSHQTVARDTVRWLDTADIPYRDLCFIGAKADVGAQCYIDDAPHNIEALRAAGNTVIIFDQPYNRHLSGLRARTWVEAEQLVYDLSGVQPAHGPA